MFERLRLRRESGPNDAVMMEAVEAANPEAVPVVTRARAVGLPWANILRIIFLFGPEAIALLEKILDALFDDETPPTPPDVPATLPLKKPS